MILVVFVAVYLLTTALVRWEQRRGNPRGPRPANRTVPTLVVLALLFATIALGIVDIPPVAQVGIVALGALALAVISGRNHDAAERR